MVILLNGCCSSCVRFYIANFIVASGNSGGGMLAADAIYAAEAKSGPEFPLESSAQKSTD